MKRKTVLKVVFPVCAIALAFGMAALTEEPTRAESEEFFVRGASVRLADEKEDNGIRFHVSMSENYFKTFTNGNGALKESVKTGTLVCPAALLPTDGKLTLETQLADGNVVGKAETTQTWYAYSDENGTKFYDSVMYVYDIPTSAHNVDLVAVGYVQDGENAPVYTAVSEPFSMSWVAKAEYGSAASTLTAEEKAALKSTYMDYTVNFHVEGTAKTETVVYEETVAKPEDPTLDGHTFVGWFNESGEKQWDFATRVLGNTNLYAKFEENAPAEYAVTLTGEQGKAGLQNLVAPEKVTAGSALKMTAISENGYGELTVHYTVNGGEERFVNVVSGEEVTFAENVNGDTTVAITDVHTSYNYFTYSVETGLCKKAALPQNVILPTKDEMGNTVAIIADYAFAADETVENLTVPSSITYIGRAVAHNAKALKSVVFEDREQDITWGRDDYNNTWAFAQTPVESIVFGAGMKTIPGVFALEAKNLKSVDFCEVTAIEGEAFRNCHALTKVTGYAALTSIAGNAFQMDVNSFVLFPMVENDTIVSYLAKTFVGTTEANVPAYVGTTPVTNLENHLFAGNTAVTSITVPATVKVIGLALAQNASALQTVTFADRTSDIIWIYDTFGSWAFAGSSVKTIHIGKGLVTIPKIFATGAAQLSTVTIGEGNEFIGSEAFKDCTALQSIALANSLKTVEADAFRGSALTSVVIPANVTYMGTAVFQDCAALSSAEFLDRTATVTFQTGTFDGSWMFFGCNQLKTLKIGDGITALPNIFAPSAAETVYIGKDVVTVGSEWLPRGATVKTAYIESQAIANLFTAANALDNAFANVETVYLADGVTPSAYITATYPVTEVIEGYVLYKKA